MIEIYDNSKAISRACDDLAAVISVIECVEDSRDDSAPAACLSATRAALTAIVREIMDAADFIARKSQKNPD